MELRVTSEQDLCYLSASDALRLFRTRKLSPVELLKAQIERAEKVEPTINAFAFTYYEEALEKAQTAGLLHWDYKNLCPTDKGFLFLNDLLSIFTTEPAMSHNDGFCHGPT